MSKGLGKIALFLIASIPSSGVCDSYNKSDILFSKRFDSTSDAYLSYANSLGADRLVWHYTHGGVSARDVLNQTSSSNVVNAFTSKDPLRQCAVPLYVKLSEPDDVHCRDLQGAPVQAPYEVSFGTNQVRGDVMKDKYLALQSEIVGAMITAGCRSLQQDAPSHNLETLKYGGCYSTEGDIKFRTYLNKHFSVAELKEFGIQNPETFLYSDFLRGGAVSQQLAALYRQFNAEKTVDYLNLLKSTATAALGAPVKLSGNVYALDRDYELYNALNFVMTEISPTYQSAQGILALASFSKRSGKELTTTLPSNSLALNKSIFASTYALGMHMILPYDVYIPDTIVPGPPLQRITNARYTAAVSQFRDLTDFIKRNAALLNGYSGLETTGSLNRSNIVRIDTLSDRLRVIHSGRTEFLNVSNGAKVLVNDQMFTCLSDSVVGFIYLPLSEEARLRQAVSLNPTLQKIENPDGTGQLFQLTLSPFGAAVTRVSLLSPTKALISLEKWTDQEIKQGDIIVINSKRFPVQHSQGFRGVEIATDQGSKPKLGETLDQIIHQDGSPGVSFTIPTELAPRVRHIDYNLTRPGHTTIRLDRTDLSLPLGTEIVFAGTGYVARNETSRSDVGNYYLQGDQRNKVFLNQAVLHIQKPDAAPMSFAKDISYAPLLTLAPTSRDVLVSVKRNAAKKTVVHIVNWSNSALSTRMLFNSQSLFGKQVTGCITRTTNSPADVQTAPISAQPGLLTLQLPPIRHWAMVTCD